MRNEIAFLTGDAAIAGPSHAEEKAKLVQQLHSLVEELERTRNR